MLILNADEVAQALPMKQAIASMKMAMQALSSGQAEIPLRTHIEANQGTTLVMPGWVSHGDHESLAVKVVSIFNGNQSRGLANILGLVHVLDAETGAPIAILNGAAVTALRTAAVSGAATASLANPDASRLAILGSGPQAKSHFQAMCAVRPVKQASFFSPRRVHVERLVASLQTDVDLHIADSSEAATREADIICTTTNSNIPVIDNAAIADGCHINAIGSYKPDVVEIPAAVVRRARVFVDHKKTALSEAGDLIQPLQRGEIETQHLVGEIGELFLGQIAGRLSADNVTLFKSVGNTVEDVVGASDIVRNAERMGLGQEISLD
ncbi:MAG: hypothetical protein P8J33_07220 [Pirellulaceae bacterium]|nr:hypothetical protein [Pirellulaceae bacterium]